MARPKKPLISHDAVVNAATEILENDGLDALSLRYLASKLNVNPASLYHHFANKEDILQAVVRVALREMELPTLSSKWDEWICENAVQYRRLLIRKPYLITLLLNNIRPHTMAYAIADAKLMEVGVPEEIRSEFLNVLDTTAVGSALVSISVPKKGSEPGIFDYEMMLRKTVRLLLNDMIQQYQRTQQKSAGKVGG